MHTASTEITDFGCVVFSKTSLHAKIPVNGITQFLVGLQVRARCGAVVGCCQRYRSGRRDATSGKITGIVVSVCLGNSRCRLGRPNGGPDIVENQIVGDAETTSNGCRSARAGGV